MELRLGLSKQKSAVALPRGFKSHSHQQIECLTASIFLLFASGRLPLPIVLTHP